MTKFNASRTATPQAVSSVLVNEISTPGQYVNNKTGILLIADKELLQRQAVGGSIFDRLVSTDETDLEFTKISANPHQPLDESRIVATRMSLPVRF